MVTISGTLLSAMRSPIMWGLIIFGMLLMGFGGLWLRKQRKLQYKCILVTPSGNGKVATILTKAGWFKEKMFLKLWDYGNEESVRLKDGRRVYGVTRDDMHFFKGQRCLIVWEKGDDRKIIVPISKLHLDEESANALAEIAPVDLRDTASQIMNENDNELTNKWAKVMPYVALAGVIMFAFISIIMITQMVKNGQAEAGRVLVEVSKNTGKQIIIPAATGAP